MSTTVIAPVGPVTWRFEPPKIAARAPATIAVIRPARAPSPEAAPKASASGSATTATVSPASRSFRGLRRAALQSADPGSIAVRRLSIGLMAGFDLARTGRLVRAGELLGTRQLGEKLALTDQHLGQEATGRLHQLRDIGCGQLVGHGRTAAGGVDDAGASQHGELLGQATGLDIQALQQLRDCHGSVLEQLQDPDTDRVAESAEQLRLGLIQGHRHDGPVR